MGYTKLENSMFFLRHKITQRKSTSTEPAAITLVIGGDYPELTHFSPLLSCIWKPVVCFALQNNSFLYETQYWAEMGLRLMQFKANLVGY